MAEEEDAGGGGEQEQKPQSGDQPQQAGGNKLLPIIIIVVLLAAIAGGLYFYFFIFSSDSPSMDATSPEEAKFIEEYMKRSQPSVEAVRGEGDPVISPTFSYTVNMADKGHMLQISFKALMYDESALEYLLKYRPVIDNNMMDLLGRVKASDMRNRAGLELLKQSIYRELNSHFADDYIVSDIHQTRDRTPVKDILISEYYIN